VVVAVPKPLIVQRNHEQVGVLEALQRRLPIGAAGDSVAQGPAHTPEYGGFKQKGPDLFGLSMEHLFDQVVQHVAVTAGEGFYESGDVGAVAQSERCHL
jgi:hypothetical protein